MVIRQKQPDMFIFNKGRNTNLGLVTGLSGEVDFDYTLNAASQCEFKVRKYIYDTDEGRWMRNPCYDNICKYNVIATTDTNSKYHFYGSELANYALAQQTPRNADNCTLNFKTELVNATLQDETELFDIGTRSGYMWQYRYEIDEYDGGVCKATPLSLKYIVTDEFFPVEAGDILAYGCQIYDFGIVTLFSYSADDSNTRFSFKLSFYTEANTAGYTSHTSYHTATPVARYRITTSDLGGQTSGYVRVSAIAKKAIDTANNEYQYCPMYGYVKIFSGERRCSSFTVRNKSQRFLPEQWWVINSCEESGEGINTIKTVSLYSYEYTLSYKTFSTAEAILPLYIPDEIIDIVTGVDNEGAPRMIVDMVTNEIREDGTYKEFKLRQRMNKGIINQILDCLPNWSIGYISADIGTRYRTIGDVDNDNIYSYLMNTVQPTYQCFIFFDTNNLKINLISYDDMIGHTAYNTHFETSTVLTWQNAITSLTIANQDSDFITAMRLHSADDMYSIGLVNPTGNNVVYNFDSIKDELDYVVDSGHTHDGVSYTLKEVIELYQQEISRVISGSNRLVYDESYMTKVSKYVNAVQKCIDLRVRLSQALSEHKSIVDRIHVYLDNDKEIRGINTYDYWYMPKESPRTLASIERGGAYAPIAATVTVNSTSTTYTYANYHSEAAYNDYYSAVETYWAVKQEFESTKELCITLKRQLKEISTYFSLNYNTVVEDRKRSRTSNTDMYYPIFTPDELLVLNNYIIEGDWRDNNATFSEQYSADDIVSTLRSLYTAGKKDLDDIYSKQNLDFEINVTDIFADKNMRDNVATAYLGNCINISNFGEWIVPILLNVHTSYSNSGNNFSLKLSTDYKRKPIELRFSKLFGTINQVNPNSSEIVYDD